MLASFYVRVSLPAVVLDVCKAGDIGAALSAEMIATHTLKLRLDKSRPSVEKMRLSDIIELPGM